MNAKQICSAAAFTLLSCSLCLAESLDFSGDQVGDTFSRGKSFPTADGPFRYCASKEGVPAGSSSSATVVETEQGKALRLTTTPKDAHASGRPFSWIKTKEAVDTSGKKLEWAAQFSISKLGNGNGLNVALLSGAGSEGFSLPLSMIQPVNGEINASPAWVIGLLFFNNKGNLQGSVRRLVADDEGNASLSTYNEAADEWKNGASNKNTVPLITGAIYTVQLSFDDNTGKVGLSLADENGELINTTFQRTELWKDVDLSTLRLGAGDMMSNSGSEWGFDVHQLQWNH